MKITKKRGFTLTELLVTVAVLGMLIVLGSRLGQRTIQRADFTASINRFVADVNYSRMMSAKDNRYVAIDFNNTGTEYSVLIQRYIWSDISQPYNYNAPNDPNNPWILLKTVSPMFEKEFFDVNDATYKVKDFAVNALGMVRLYPVDLNSTPTSVKFYVFRMGERDWDVAYKRLIIIYPSGGIKIEKPKDFIQR
jgi:prepilin-type N-terminal cleavage/methylation domain-containing protein